MPPSYARSVTMTQTSASALPARAGGLDMNMQSTYVYDAVDPEAELTIRRQENGAEIDHLIHCSCWSLWIRMGVCVDCGVRALVNRDDLLMSRGNTDRYLYLPGRETRVPTDQQAALPSLPFMIQNDCNCILGVLCVRSEEGPR